ncbi:DUF2927 domain-containing protein [Paroceanicella profunda]|uniref:DUF2927 domain-containing protein n=1 Tax=Paroceanicella profunda TaxID=2579971 RepID=A0A5B8FG16_9RHOB|nr:DUF2927 domain-containing protein [Paroceanicella profunda]QDL90671.1 DUF2927 domain-containing protein [Paroceanicella profunda]
MIPPARALLAATSLLAGCASSDRTYYSDLERMLRGEGLMRTEAAPADAPYTGATLVENFERIALYSEYANENGRFITRRTAIPLSRWEGPVRVQAVFGDSVPRAQQREDMAQLRRFTARLARVSALDIALLPPGAEEPANFYVFYVDRAERVAMADMLDGSDIPPDPAVIDSLRHSPVSEICYANTFNSLDTPGLINFALIVIKGETEGLMRLSCLHEELTQALGLGNDDPRVRPSIFNDDEEFALLTRHDVALLRMLYDPALHPGMTLEEARPLLPDIAGRALAAEEASLAD